MLARYRPMLCRVSVCLSHSVIVSKRLNVGSRKFIMSHDSHGTLCLCDCFTRQYFVKKAKIRITQITPYDGQRNFL